MMRPFTYLLAIVAVLYLTTGNAQSHRYRAFGGTGNEEIRDFIPTADGNFLGVGYIKALGYVHGSLGNKDALVLKMTPDGDILWAKSYGGDYDEEFSDVVSYQGHYYCVGFTNSWQIAGTTSNTDAFLVKLDFAGEVQWTKHYGEPMVSARYNDIGANIIATGNGTGVMFVGSTGAGNGADQNIIAFRVLPDGSTGFAKSYDLPDLSGANQSGDFGRWPTLVANNEYVIAGNVWGGQWKS